jgi:hypothetical protein
MLAFATLCDDADRDARPLPALLNLRHQFALCNLIRTFKSPGAAPVIGGLGALQRAKRVKKSVHGGRRPLCTHCPQCRSIRHDKRLGAVRTSVTSLRPPHAGEPGDSHVAGPPEKTVRQITQSEPGCIPADGSDIHTLDIERRVFVPESILRRREPSWAGGVSALVELGRTSKKSGRELRTSRSVPPRGMPRRGEPDDRHAKSDDKEHSACDVGNCPHMHRVRPSPAVPSPRQLSSRSLRSTCAPARRQPRCSPGQWPRWSGPASGPCQRIESIADIVHRLDHESRDGRPEAGVEQPPRHAQPI